MLVMQYIYKAQSYTMFDNDIYSVFSLTKI